MMSDSPEEIIGCEVQDVKSNVLIGTMGAIIGAILGGAVWVLVYQLGYVAFIAGVAIIFCSYKGYTLLSKRKDTKGAIIATIASVLILLIAHFLCWGIDVSAAYEIPLFDAIFAVPTLVFDPEIIAEDSSLIIAFCKDLLIGLLLIGVGFFTYIRHDLKAAAAARLAAKPAGTV